MKTDTRERIVAFVTEQRQVSAKTIIGHLGLTPPAVFRHLSKLVADQVLKKQGTPPKVFYSLASPIVTDHTHIELDADTERTLNERFLKITPDGLMQTGAQAFIQWCLMRKLDPVKTASEYVTSTRKFEAYQKNGLIDGMVKMRRTFPSVSLDGLYYLDFYTIERFGKIKLGELVLYAKQSQSPALMKHVVADVRDRIHAIMKRLDIDAVGFIPPTVKRDLQFMKELERLLRLPTPVIQITKIRTPIIIPQKTLSKLEERIENARQSLVVEEQKIYRNILLIDDAIGSGATINEVASQIRAKKICTGKIIGLALVGSFNGFDVIQEM